MNASQVWAHYRVSRLNSWSCVCLYSYESAQQHMMQDGLGYVFRIQVLLLVMCEVLWVTQKCWICCNKPCYELVSKFTALFRLTHFIRSKILARDCRKPPHGHKADTVSSGKDCYCATFTCRYCWAPTAKLLLAALCMLHPSLSFRRGRIITVSTALAHACMFVFMPSVRNVPNVLQVAPESPLHCRRGHLSEPGGCCAFARDLQAEGAV